MCGKQTGLEYNIELLTKFRKTLFIKVSLKVIFMKPDKLVSIITFES
jgi:hypothetical protein